MRWEIQARSRSCAKCQKEFFNGDAYRCVLAYRGDEPLRQDFCEGCWDAAGDIPLAEGEELISWWRSTVRIPPAKPKEEVIKRSVAEELLRKYLHSPDPKHGNFCYILALMLERRRVLSQKHTIQEDPSGKTLLVYEHAKSGETFIVIDPHLDLSRIGKVQAEVKEILDAEQKVQEAAEAASETDPSEEEENPIQEETGK